MAVQEALNRRVAVYYIDDRYRFTRDLAEWQCTELATSGEEAIEAEIVIIVAPKSVWDRANIEKTIRLARRCQEEGKPFVIASYDWRMNGPYQNRAEGREWPIIQVEESGRLRDVVLRALPLPLAPLLTIPAADFDPKKGTAW